MFGQWPHPMFLCVSVFYGFCVLFTGLASTFFQKNKFKTGSHDTIHTFKKKICNSIFNFEFSIINSIKTDPKSLVIYQNCLLIFTRAIFLIIFFFFFNYQIFNNKKNVRCVTHVGSNPHLMNLYLKSSSQPYHVSQVVFVLASNHFQKCFSVNAGVWLCMENKFSRSYLKLTV